MIENHETGRSGTTCKSNLAFILILERIKVLSHMHTSLGRFPFLKANCPWKYTS